MITSPSTPSAARPKPAWANSRPHFLIARPFVSIWVAASVLNCTEHRVAAWLEDGTLPFAFNIARPGVRRACVRLATTALQGRLAGRQRFGAQPEFLAATFPPDIPIYEPAKLAWMMQCDYDHIYNLIRARALADVGRRSYEISRESLLRFLNERSLY
jgi:hypothetical protein